MTRLRRGCSLAPDLSPARRRLMRIRHHLLRAALLASTVAASSGARAADLGISPVLVRLSREEPSALITLHNAGSTPTRMTVKVYAWSQDERGEMTLAPTTDVVAFPPILEIAADASRNVRVGTTLSPAAEERSYRLFLEELPAARNEEITRVQVLSRIGIPVFVEPSSPSAKLVVADPVFSPGKVVVALENRGNAHARPIAVHLELTDGGGKPVLQKELEPWYVLPQGRRVYEIPLAEGTCAAAQALSLDVRFEVGEPLHRTVQIPLEACPR